MFFFLFSLSPTVDKPCNDLEKTLLNPKKQAKIQVLIHYTIVSFTNKTFYIRCFSFTILLKMRHFLYSVTDDMTYDGVL